MSGILSQNAARCVSGPRQKLLPFEGIRREAGRAAGFSELFDLGWFLWDVFSFGCGFAAIWSGHSGGRLSANLVRVTDRKEFSDNMVG